MIMRVKPRRRLKKGQITLDDIKRIEQHKKIMEDWVKEAKRRAPAIKRIAKERAERMPYLDHLEAQEGLLKTQIRQNAGMGRLDLVVLLEAELAGLQEEIAARKKEMGLKGHGFGK